MDGYQVEVKGGGYRIPQKICVSCGGSAPIVSQIKRSVLDHKTRLDVGFPLCQDCDTVRTRVKAARRPMVWKTLLLGLPVAAVLSALFALGTGNGLSGDFTLDHQGVEVLALGIMIWLPCSWLLYRALRDVGSGAAASPDRARAKEIEASVDVRIFGSNLARFRFSNPRYGFAFQLANDGTVVPPK